MRPFQVRAPGRLCLFGEHSDYLGLDVIPMAMSLCITIEATPRSDTKVNVQYSDLDERDSFELTEEITYRHKRDYLRSAFNVIARDGGTPICGLDLVVRGDIPIAVGLSSSSALAVASVMTAAHVYGAKIEEERLARLAHRAEVVEFGESGGMQDHFASAVGGIIHLDLGNDYHFTKLPVDIGEIVIGDSLEKKKDTVGDIQYIKRTVESEYAKMAEFIDSFDRRTTSVERVYSLQKSRPNDERRMAEATLRNRDLTERAFRILSKPTIDCEEIGEMLQEHHGILRDGLGRSTPKIERLIDVSYSAGALGCKINGSGGGGCMMAYAPGMEDEVSSAIEKAGGKAYIIQRGHKATLLESG